VGCGRLAPKSELIRLVVARDAESPASRVVLDPAATMAGRGAYLCRGASASTPAGECLTLATRRDRIARALRCAVVIDAKLLESVGL
jgi:predicted RNA-binding protein YlxR (DUF448 family)